MLTESLPDSGRRLPSPSEPIKLGIHAAGALRPRGKGAWAAGQTGAAASLYSSRDAKRVQAFTQEATGSCLYFCKLPWAVRKGSRRDYCAIIAGRLLGS